MGCQAFCPQLWYIFNMKDFAERLKELRLEKGLTQKQLAQNTGLSKSAIDFWEREQRVPNANAIIVLAKFFSVTSDYLLGLED